MKIISVFTRNLRLYDNPILEGFSQNEIIPVFLTDYLRTLPDNSNLKKYTISVLANFRKSLNEIGSHIHILNLETLKFLLELAKPDELRIVFDADKNYKELTIKIEKICKNSKVKFRTFCDFLTKYDTRISYANFKQFYKKKFLKDVSFPIKVFNKPKTIFTQRYKIKEENIEEYKDRFTFALTEDEAIKHFISFKEKQLLNYEKTRDYPAIEGTSKISPYLRVGLLSYRFVFLESEENEKFRTELSWSEFNRHIAIHFKNIANKEIKAKWIGFPWSRNISIFNKWSSGKTGFPLVDAGIRELLETGFIHNRVRMVTASFLTKNLLIDWRMGESFFAKNLIDYDSAENIGNWQWIAGCGMDAAPYFRVFNPILQAKRFDPYCEYIKRFIPELTNENCKEILNMKIENALYNKPLIDINASRNHYLLFVKNFLKANSK